MKRICPALYGCGAIEFHTSAKKLRKRMIAEGIKCKKDRFEGCAGAVCHEYLRSHGVLYVLVADCRTSTFAHEIFHAAVRYLGWINVPLKKDDANEAYAYFIDYLTSEFFPVLEDARGLT